MFFPRRQFFSSLAATFAAAIWPARSTPMREGLPSLEINAVYDVVVVGGGIAGISAAIAAARNGAQVLPRHERSILGANSSSEVRLYPENATAHQVWIKECGIFEEIHAEERVRNHEPYREGLMNCQWDLVLYEW